MRRLSRHVGINILVAIAMALLVLVGLDVIAAIIDEAGATRNNYHFSDIYNFFAFLLYFYKLVDLFLEILQILKFPLNLQYRNE